MALSTNMPAPPSPGSYNSPSGYSYIHAPCLCQAYCQCTEHIGYNDAITTSMADSWPMPEWTDGAGAYRPGTRIMQMPWRHFWASTKSCVHSKILRTAPRHTAPTLRRTSTIDTLLSDPLETLHLREDIREEFVCIRQKPPFYFYPTAANRASPAGTILNNHSTRDKDRLGCPKVCNYIARASSHDHYRPGKSSKEEDEAGKKEREP